MCSDHKRKGLQKRWRRVNIFQKEKDIILLLKKVWNTHTIININEYCMWVHGDQEAICACSKIINSSRTSAEFTENYHITYLHLQSSSLALSFKCKRWNVGENLHHFTIILWFNKLIERVEPCDYENESAFKINWSDTRAPRVLLLCENLLNNAWFGWCAVQDKSIRPNPTPFLETVSSSPLDCCAGVVWEGMFIFLSSQTQQPYFIWTLTCPLYPWARVEKSLLIELDNSVHAYFEKLCMQVHGKNKEEHIISYTKQ